ncbi:Protein of uncharacterised function (DUF2786) [Enterobacter cloacae]|uniref:Protein of uncharacterized function (DUF2786) n=1 Tax=Enterobacter cloacae TaxID=550 RepID=A0A377MB81_ENTCL|nr:Protein of uncharacterised function (DUF2786) [Enterobacter cloacae]
MSDNAKITARIRRLMALGTRNSNPHEAARAVALAQRLMQRHGLTPDMLSLSDVSESVCFSLTSDAEKVPAWLSSLQPWSVWPRAAVAGLAGMFMSVHRA